MVTTTLKYCNDGMKMTYKAPISMSSRARHLAADSKLTANKSEPSGKGDDERLRKYIYPSE